MKERDQNDKNKYIPRKKLSESERKKIQERLCNPAGFTQKKLSPDEKNDEQKSKDDLFSKIILKKDIKHVLTKSERKEAKERLYKIEKTKSKHIIHQNRSSVIEIKKSNNKIIKLRSLHKPVDLETEYEKELKIARTISDKEKRLLFLKK